MIKNKPIKGLCIAFLSLLIVLRFTLPTIAGPDGYVLATSAIYCLGLVFVSLFAMEQRIWKKYKLDIPTISTSLGLVGGVLIFLLMKKHELVYISLDEKNALIYLALEIVLLVLIISELYYVLLQIQKKKGKIQWLESSTAAIVSMIFFFDICLLIGRLVYFGKMTFFNQGYLIAAIVFLCIIIEILLDIEEKYNKKNKQFEKLEKEVRSAENRTIKLHEQIYEQRERGYIEGILCSLLINEPKIVQIIDRNINRIEILEKPKIKGEMFTAKITISVRYIDKNKQISSDIYEFIIFLDSDSSFKKGQAIAGKDILKINNISVGRFELI